MSMIVIGHSLPILRQRWCCLLYDVYWPPIGCSMWITGLKYLEYNSSIRTKNTLNSQTLINLTKALIWTKHWMKQRASFNYFLKVIYIDFLSHTVKKLLTILRLFNLKIYNSALLTIFSFDLKDLEPLPENPGVHNSYKFKIIFSFNWDKMEYVFETWKKLWKCTVKK